MIYENFRVTGVRDIVLDYADLFTLTLQNDDVQDFDTRWDEILLSMSKIITDDVLENLYKLRIREFDQPETVVELYEMEIHQKVSKPAYQRLKIKVKRTTEQQIKSRNFQSRTRGTE